MAIGSVYRPLLDALREAGVDVDARLAQLGLSYAQLVEPGARLHPDQGRALGRIFEDEAERFALGLRAAERFAASDADLVGYIMCHSPHPLAAVQALAEHARLLGDSAEVTIEQHANRVQLSVGTAGGRQMLPFGYDFALAAICKLIRECSRGRTVPIAVQLPRPRPRRPAQYTQFFGAPVRFAAAKAALIYDRDSMSIAFAQSDQRLVRILETHANAVAATLPEMDAWHARVRVQIADGLARGGYDLDSIARRCGIGERTLRRRLSDAGTSYRALVDDVRNERAHSLLAELDNVSAVAQQLGFSDATAFARAFRRWTGSLPHQHLRMLRARADANA